LTPSDDLSYYKFTTQLDNAKQINFLSRKQWLNDSDLVSVFQHYW
jgi:hypothetical protein